MTVEITQTGVRHFEVRTDRLGLVGHIFEFNKGPYRFKYTSDTWTKMTVEELNALYVVVNPKITLLNITRRLTK